MRRPFFENEEVGITIDLIHQQAYNQGAADSSGPSGPPSVPVSLLPSAYGLATMPMLTYLSPRQLEQPLRPGLQSLVDQLTTLANDYRSTRALWS